MAKHLIGATKKKRSGGKVSRGVAKIVPTLSNWQSFTVGILAGMAVSCFGFYVISEPVITVKIPATSVSNAPSAIKANEQRAEAALQAPVEEKIAVKEPRFDFYTELTKNSQDTNQAVSKPQVLDLKSPPKTINKYMIQAGAFRNRSEADALKAQLTLNGLNAKIEVAKLEDGNMWHRVVFGPFKTENIAQQQKKLLKSYDVNDALVLKQSDY